MKKQIEFALDDGSRILVEVDEPEAAGGVVRAGRSDMPEKARHTFTDALSKIRPIAESAISKLRELSDPPDSVEVEFGIKLSAEAGVVLASAGTEANLKVTLGWERQR